AALLYVTVGSATGCSVEQDVQSPTLGTTLFPTLPVASRSTVVRYVKLCGLPAGRLPAASTHVTTVVPPAPGALLQEDGNEPGTSVCPTLSVSVKTTSVGRGPPVTSTERTYSMVLPASTSWPEAGSEDFRVDTDTMGSLSDALSLLPSGSVVPAGGAMVAVLIAS